MPRVSRKPGPGADRLKIALAGIEGKVGKVGWFPTAVYEGGTPVALVAAVNEYGWPEHNIPPRLGMRATADEKRREWAEIAESGAKAILAGNETPGSVMEAIGLKAAGDMRKHIAAVDSPPLMPSTIRRRQLAMADKKTVGSLAKPLINTGHMLNTLTNTVENK